MHGLATVSGAMFVGPYILRAAEVGKDKLRMANVGTGGRAGAHMGVGDITVAYCDVDKKRWPKKSARNEAAQGYTDYRQMLEKHEKEIDAVTVGTPDHNHFPASMLAIKMGKHVYCEKPLTWSVAEARALAEATAAKKVATQMGNQGHSNEGNRLTVEWIRAGAIGDVKEIHTWTNRPVWPQGIAQRPASKPVPEGLDWECWIGPAPYRDYHDGLHDFKWRGWFDFGCGAVGDMGCHTWDCVFWAMDPDYPSMVELMKIEGRNKETFPTKCYFKWTFPAKGTRAAFDAFWYEGGMKPAVPEEMVNDPYYKDKKNPNKPIGLPGSGTLFIGTKGKLLVQGDYGDSPRLIPEPAMQAFKRPEKTIPRVTEGHHGNWILACRGEKPWNYPGSNFATYAGPLTEVMLLGAISQRIGEEGFKIECDPVARTVKTKEALQYVTREYRKGWNFMA